VGKMGGDDDQLCLERKGKERIGEESSKQKVLPCKTALIPAIITVEEVSRDGPIVKGQLEDHLQGETMRNPSCEGT
jgi:hypothetical protein